MIEQILYNCDADCTVLIRNPHVISGEGARHLRPPSISAPGYHHLTNVTNLYLLAATETKRCYVTIKHLNLNFPQQCNLKVYSRWLWIFLSLKSPEEWEITKQACRDESVFFSYFQYIYIYIYQQACIRHPCSRDLSSSPTGLFRSFTASRALSWLRRWTSNWIYIYTLKVSGL